MPSTISRTYGKKPAHKRKSSASDDEKDDTKRRRVSPKEREGSTDAEDLPNSLRSLSPGSSSKPTKETPGTTPTKLTKRMLGRSKTESSIDSQPPATSMAARTISMPAISPSSQNPPQGQSHERRPAISSSASTPRVKHTYAGQSRSFLISLPVAEINPDAIQGIERTEEEFFEPESYSSLRLRWGVDNSEDDPLLPPMSPSRSKSNSNNGTPRKGKGKAKAPAVYLPPNMMNPLKSITELRSKGESRRFLDEVGYLFEGMDHSNTTGLKRSSALEITAKLCDEEFARKAKAADFYHKTWDVFLKAGAGRGEDKILDILLVFLVALIARNRDALIELAHQEISPDTHTAVAESSIVKGKGKENEEPSGTLVSILFFILKNSADIDPLAMISPLYSASDIEFKQIGLSKKDKIMLSSIYSTISTKSSIFPDDTPITTTLLTIHILHSLPPSYIPQIHIVDLLHSLRSLLHISFSPNEPFDGTYPEDSDREPQYECIRNHLHLLDMYLLNQWTPEDDDESLKQRNLEELRVAGDEWLVDGLIPIAVCAEIKLRADDAIDQVSECLEVLLRVLINLTHRDEDWALKVVHNDFAVPFIVRLLATSGLKTSRIDDDEDVKPKPEQDDEIVIVEPSTTTKKRPIATRTSDRLCLALGLLTNLVQSAPEFKDTLGQTELSPTCSLQSASCAKKCTCLGPINTLQILVKVYEAQSLSSMHTASADTELKVKHEASPTPPLPSFVPPTAMEADAHIIQGTLAILFGLLMHSSPSNQRIILSSMHTVRDRAKLARLVEQGKEFVAFYDALSGGEREDRSASEVVEILERLRDDC